MNAVTPLPTSALLPDRTASAVAVTLIDIRQGRRALDPVWVEALSDMLDADGLHTPIDLVIRGSRFDLVAGRHRLAAATALGWATIPAFALSLAEWAGENALKLREIAENLIRRELTALDRAFDIAQWRDIYVATHNVAKRGRPKTVTSHEEQKNTDTFVSNFSTAAQAALRVDQRTIFRDLKIASLGQPLRERLSLHPIADNQSELLFLARQEPARREAIADLLLADPPRAGTVAEAIMVLDNVPVTVAPKGFERLSNSFSRLKPAEQEAFFELHADAVHTWLSKRIAAAGGSK